LLIFIGVCGIGGTFNIMFIVQEERVPQFFLGASLELTLALTKLFAGFAPIISALQPPFPMSFLVLVGTVTLLFSFKLKPPLPRMN